MSFLKEFMKGERKVSREHHVYQVATEEGAEEAATTEGPITTEETTTTPTEEATSTTGAPEDTTTTTATPAEADTVTETPTPPMPMTVTTSMVMTSSEKPSPTVKKGRMSKLEAASEYVYGRKEEPWMRPEMPPMSEIVTEVRPNRAQTMRHSCILKRVKEEERERARVMDEKEMQKQKEKGITEPVIVARVIPQSLYQQPKIMVRDTKSSKFRYLFNRKPPGVTVYFKPADADAKKKPPFVVSAVQRCY